MEDDFMKMVMAVIHDEDSHKLVDKLFNAGYSSTKLASTGGLLRTGNTTLFVGVEGDKVDAVIEIIKDTCQTNKRISLINPPTASATESYMPYPIEVVVGGATVFVLDVDKYMKF